MAVYKAASAQHRLFRAGLKLFERTISAVSRDTYMKMAVEIIEVLERVARVETPEGSILFHCDSEVARIRAKGMLLREPDTLDWIRTFDKGDTFLDIGSNVGVFALFAAVAREATVIACDPLPHNNYAITRNAVLNGVSDRLTPICIALNDESGIAELTVPGVADATGGAGATFGEQYDNYFNPIDASYTLLVPGISVDCLIETFSLPVPTHIKMDIDGIQEKVIAGAAETLKDNRVRTVMLELQPKDNEHNKSVYEYIVSAMQNTGFELTKIAPTSPNGTTDPMKSATNHFFSRP